MTATQSEGECLGGLKKRHGSTKRGRIFLRRDAWRSATTEGGPQTLAEERTEDRGRHRYAEGENAQDGVLITTLESGSGLRFCTQPSGRDRKREQGRKKVTSDRV